MAHLYPRVHWCFFGIGWIIVRGKAVYTSICSVLLCAVLNMTRIKRLSVVMSSFEGGSGLFSFNYGHNAAY